MFLIDCITSMYHVSIIEWALGNNSGKVVFVSFFLFWGKK